MNIITKNYQNLMGVTWGPFIKLAGNDSKPIFKTEDRTKIKNYKPVRLFDTFSKNHEIFLREKLNNYIDVFLTKFV